MKATRFLAIAVLLGVAACDSESSEPSTDPSTEPSVTQKALDELQAKYDELVGDQLDDPTQWAADDLENIGDWEYQVKEIPFESNEELTAALNELGNERWEVFWIERTDDGFLVLLKKPSVSYLSKIPLSQIGRFVIGGSDSQ